MLKWNNLTEPNQTETKCSLLNHYGSEKDKMIAWRIERIIFRSLYLKCNLVYWDLEARRLGEQQW